MLLPCYVISRIPPKRIANIHKQWLRTLVGNMLEEYKKAQTKSDKSNIISDVVEYVRTKGRFVKRDCVTGKWIYAEPLLCREKCSQSFRDNMAETYRSSNVAKRNKRRQEQQDKRGEGASAFATVTTATGPTTAASIGMPDAKRMKTTPSQIRASSLKNGLNPTQFFCVDTPMPRIPSLPGLANFDGNNNSLPVPFHHQQQQQQPAATPQGSFSLTTAGLDLSGIDISALQNLLNGNTSGPSNPNNAGSSMSHHDRLMNDTMSNIVQQQHQQQQHQQQQHQQERRRFSDVLQDFDTMRRVSLGVGGNGKGNENSNYHPHALNDNSSSFSNAGSSNIATSNINMNSTHHHHQPSAQAIRRASLNLLSAFPDLFGAHQAFPSTFHNSNSNYGYQDSSTSVEQCMPFSRNLTSASASLFSEQPQPQPQHQGQEKRHSFSFTEADWFRLPTDDRVDNVNGDAPKFRNAFAA